MFISLSNNLGMNLHNFSHLFYLHIHTTDDDRVLKFLFRINIINHVVFLELLCQTKAFTFTF